MIISRERAVVGGVVAVGGIVVLHAFNTFGCGVPGHLMGFMVMFGIFVLPPLVPALISLATANPLRAIGACLLLAPWWIRHV